MSFNMWKELMVQMGGDKQNQEEGSGDDLEEDSDDEIQNTTATHSKLDHQDQESDVASTTSQVLLQQQQLQKGKQLDLGSSKVKFQLPDKKFIKNNNDTSILSNGSSQQNLNTSGIIKKPMSLKLSQQSSGQNQMAGNNIFSQNQNNKNLSSQNTPKVQRRPSLKQSNQVNFNTSNNGSRNNSRPQSPRLLVKSQKNGSSNSNILQNSSSKIQQLDNNSNSQSQKFLKNNNILSKAQILQQNDKLQQSSLQQQQKFSKHPDLSNNTRSSLNKYSVLKTSRNQPLQQQEFLSSSKNLMNKQNSFAETMNQGFKYDMSYNSNQNDPMNQTGYFKKKFMTDFNDQEEVPQRPSTNQTMRPNRNRLNQKQEQEGGHHWLKRPKNLQDLDNLFSTNISFTQNQENLKEFSQMLENWILEMKKLEKVLDIQAIQTDSLVQEISVWQDVVRVYQQFDKELQDNYTKKVESLWKEKAQFDEDLKKKYQHYSKLKKAINQYKPEMIEFAKKIHENCFEDFKNLVNAQYTQYPNIYESTLNKILDLFLEYPELFNFRIYFVLEKVYILLIRKMKQCNVNFNMCADIDNSKFIQNLIQGFETYTIQLIEIWAEVCDTRQNKDSTNKIHSTMFTKKLQQLKYVLRDINKMRSIFDKLNIQKKQYMKQVQTEPIKDIILKIDNMLNLYQETKIEFDLLDYANKQNWDDIVRQFKTKLGKIKDQMQELKTEIYNSDQEGGKNKQQQQKQEENIQDKEQDGSGDDMQPQNPFFSTLVTWKVE